MRNLLKLLPLLIFISSCNDTDKEHARPSATSDAKEDSMKAGIARFPDSMLLQENLVQYYRDNGAYDKAIGLVNTMVAANSNDAHLWDIKGTLHFEDDDTLNAIHAYEKAIRLNPGNPVLVMTLGSLYAQTKDPRSLEVADALINNPQALAEKEGIFIKGLYYSYTGDKKKAISFFDKSLALDYTFMFAYREKGIALYDMGKYEEALNVLNRAITLQNNYDEGYYWMGRCLEKLNRTEEAIESYRTALSYDPDFIEAKEALAKLGVK
ncbi:MAG: tetratricopeptide repeat protein [Ferruginibacter sp.]